MSFFAESEVENFLADVLKVGERHYVLNGDSGYAAH